MPTHHHRSNADIQSPAAPRQPRHDQTRRRQARRRATLLTLIALTLIGVTIALSAASLPGTPTTVSQPASQTTGGSWSIG